MQLSRNSRQLREVSACFCIGRRFYLGVLLDSVSFRAYSAQKRVNKPLSVGSLFLSSVDQPAILRVDEDAGLPAVSGGHQIRGF